MTKREPLVLIKKDRDATQTDWGKSVHAKYSSAESEWACHSTHPNEVGCKMRETMGFTQITAMRPKRRGLSDGRNFRATRKMMIREKGGFYTTENRE